MAGIEAPKSTEEAGIEAPKGTIEVDSETHTGRAPIGIMYKGR